MKKVLAVASGGGHWRQLMLLKPAFEQFNVKYITTINGLPEQDNIKNYYIVKDSNKNEKLAAIYSFIQLFYIFCKFRPDVIVTTGAAPGLLMIILGKIFFRKTIWIDSIANAEELSLCGKLSKSISNITLTQWTSLVKGKVQFKGSVF